MSLVFVVLVIISSVVAIEEKYFDMYESLCETSRTIGRYTMSNIQTLMKDYRSDSWNDNTDYSVGFYFNNEICQSIKQKGFSSSKLSFSTFLSDDDQYLYAYIHQKFQFKEELRPGIAETRLNEAYNPLPSFPLPFASNRVLFVLWLKEKRITKSSHSYKIDYSYKDSYNVIKNSVTTEKLLKRTDHQILLKGISFKNIELNISYVSEPSSKISDKITISDSYLIVCSHLSPYKSSRLIDCKPIEENEEIKCKCKAVRTQVIMFLVVLVWAAFLIAITKPVMEIIVESERVDKVAFHIQHNCNERNFKYKDAIILRMAKLNRDFDLKNVTIDVEFFTHKNESIAPNFRFRAKVLESKPVIDIKLIIWRLTKMPELKYVQVCHSGKAGGKICLLGVFHQCVMRETSDTLTWYKIVKSITRTPRQFNLRKCKPDQDAIDAEERPLKRLRLSQINLSLLEIIFILFVDIMFMAFVSTLIHSDFNENVLIEMFTSIILTTLLGIAFNISFVLFYKYLLMMEMKVQTRMNSQNERILFIVIRVFYGLSIVMTIILSTALIIMREEHPFIVIYRWIAVLVCSTALVAIVWNMITHWEIWFPPKKIMSEESTLTVNSASVNASVNDLSV